MAILKMNCLILFVLCILLFVNSSHQLLTKRHKRQNSANSRNFPSVARASINFPRPVSMEEFRKQLLYPVEDNDYVHQISGSTPLADVPLLFRLPFFGFEFNYMWIQKDGYVLFSRGKKEYRFPIEFPSKIIDSRKEVDPSLIAPWFSSQDLPSEIPESGVYKKVVTIEKEPDDMLRERLILDFQEGMIGASDFVPRFVIIVTWMNVTFASRQEKKEVKTNTYQMLLATDEIRTYAMFNYDQIEWISHGDTYDGMKGAPVFVGFNGGNRTRAFELRPYSQNPRIQLLSERGYGNNLKGRWIFQIDEEIWSGSCVEKELDPNWIDRARLTFFPRWGNMLGGTMVNITGPCLGKDIDTTEEMLIICKFDIFDVTGFKQSINHATCLQPPVMYHGYIDLSVSVNNGPFHFVGKYYIQPPDIARDGIVVRENKDVTADPSSFTLLWRRDDLMWKDDVKASFHLWGYEETSESYPTLTYIDTLVESAVMVGKQRYDMDLVQFRTRRNYGKTHLTFGFISMNLTDTSSFGRNIKHSPTIWSRPMPLAWYFRPQWEREYPDGWKTHFCEDWFYREKNLDSFAHTVFRCPCHRIQADFDRGRFSPDAQCNAVDGKCEVFHREAKHCVRVGRPAVGSAGQLCCYDDHGELLRTADTMYAGRPSRAFKYGKHPYKWRMMVPTLSHWLNDVVPFFFCCKWSEEQDNSETCYMYKYWRTSQDCTSYQMPGVASVFGDPHFVTFDNQNFTFNGKGEFALVHVKGNVKVHELDVQGRFEQVPPLSINSPLVNGTRLTAVAVKDNTSSVVEFRLRPSAARWRYHLYVIVDKEYVFFWDDSLRIQTFKGVTLYQPTGIWNMSHIVAMFDSGAGVEVMNIDGNLGLHVYLPLNYLNATEGLLGNWTRDKMDDFTIPGRPPIRPSGPEDLHFRFGMKWRLTETTKSSFGNSLFFHDAVDFSQYDDLNFRPEFADPLKVPENFSMKSQISKICSSSAACEYDLVVTGNKEFAEKTKLHEARAVNLATLTRDTSFTRCPELLKPRNGRKSEISYKPEAIVSFSCDKGYRLVGYETRKCRDIGLWTWGIDAECISETSYNRQIAGIAVGIIIPVLLLLIIIIGCFLYRRRMTDTHYTGEKGMPNRAVMEIKRTNRTSDADYDQKQKMETET